MKYVIIIFCLIINLKSYSQNAFPDKLILSIGDTLICKVNMINSQNIFITDGVKNKRGKRKPKEKVIPISQVKDVILKSNPTISNKFYTKLLGKFNVNFFELKCRVLRLEYDASKKIVISETYSLISSELGISTYVGITVLNNKKFLTISRFENSKGFVNIPKGSKIIFHLQNGEKIEFIANKDFTSNNNNQLIAKYFVAFETEVVEVTKSSLLRVTIPLDESKLVKLADLKFKAISIETVDSEITFKVDSDKIDSSNKGCKCGLNMN